VLSLESGAQTTGNSIEIVLLITRVESVIMRWLIRHEGRQESGPPVNIMDDT
jgi:hypothetical protein